MTYQTDWCYCFAKFPKVLSCSSSGYIEHYRIALMFPSFTGNTRPRRNVNLSGRTSNPFASASQSSASTPNPQNTLAHAQQERLLRQKERERPPAALRIQRYWRGSRGRRKIKEEWRERWDSQERTLYEDEDTFLVQLILLVRFTTLSNDEDIRRLQSYAKRLSSVHRIQSWHSTRTAAWTSPLRQLGRLVIECLTFISHSPKWKLLDYNALLEVLSLVSDSLPQFVIRNHRVYYDALARTAHLFANNVELKRHSTALLEACLAPLADHVSRNSDQAVEIYSAFASEFLTSGDPVIVFDGVNALERHDLDGGAISMHYGSLTRAIKSLLQSEQPSQKSVLSRKTHDELLWLLAYYIRFEPRGGAPANVEPGEDTAQMFVVSRLISHLAFDIKHRTDASMGFQHDDFDVNNRRKKEKRYEPLAPFVREELARLSSKENIGGLVARLDIDTAGNAEQAATLATYLLTLMRVFPAKGDEIRMWLYQGPSQQGLPIVKYFFKALTATEVYQAIQRSSKEAVSLLRTDVNNQNMRQQQKLSDSRNQQWRVMLLFVELYSFVLTIMDDEEFLSGSHTVDQGHSRMRQNALPLDQVKSLSIFLKNLCFAMYWNLGDIVGLTSENSSESSIAQYFATKPGTTARQILKAPVDDHPSLKDPALAGMPGMTLKHVRGIATALLRRLYERDSRRPFMPRDHWLMTERFSMDQFIGAVVQEEEQKRRWLADGEESEDSEDSDHVRDPDMEDHLVGIQHIRDVRRMERLKQEQRKRSSRRVLESITPRLEIIQNLPFFVPFETRVQIFRTFVKADQLRRRQYNDPEEWRVHMMQRRHHDIGRHQARVHRRNIFEDAFDSFYNLGDGLKEPIQITFVDDFDIPEEGIDGGGVTKEFLTSVTNEVLDPSKSDFFVENDQHLLYPNPSILDERRELLRSAGIKSNEPITDLLRRYEFLGRIIGKCLYEGVLVDIHFAPFFLLKWALTGGSTAASNETNYRPTINDLRDMDESLYQGLLSVKNYAGNVRDLDLTFELTDTISPTQTITRELRPNGSSIPVTNENRPLYLTLIARHRLQNQPRHQTAAFLRGLSAIISPNWLSMFNQSELQTLVGGSPQQISIADLRKNTSYGGLYTIGDDGEEHPTIKLFWRVLVEDFTEEERQKLLKFVTSTPRAPLLGFGQLNPRFSVRDSGTDEERLPSTSTCVNLLKLPVYRTREGMRRKLRYSVNAGAGFNLS